MASPVFHSKLPTLLMRILSGCNSSLLTKPATKIIFIGEANQSSNLTQRFSGFQKETLRMVNTQFGQVIERSFSGKLLKDRSILPQCYPCELSQLLHGDTLRIVILHILDGLFHGIRGTWHLLGRIIMLKE
ncbi:hypothetical protein D3C78_880110 [compost metagenome]